MGAERQADSMGSLMDVLRPDKWSVLLAALILLICGALLYKPPPPRVPTGVDYVVPDRLRAGEIFTVFRTFRVTRWQEIRITRDLIASDCAKPKTCEVLNLETNSVTQEVRDYVNLSRKHQIPVGARPGVYQLRFTIHWEDHLGRTLSQAMPPLSIEVLP